MCVNDNKKMFEHKLCYYKQCTLPVRTKYSINKAEMKKKNFYHTVQWQGKHFKPSLSTTKWEGFLYRGVQVPQFFVDCFNKNHGHLIRKLKRNGGGGEKIQLHNLKILPTLVQRYSKCAVGTFRIAHTNWLVRWVIQILKRWHLAKTFLGMTCS